MKNGKIWRKSLVRLTLLYIFLSVLTMFIFTVPAFIAQEKARERFEYRSKPPDNLYLLEPPGTMQLEEWLLDRSRVSSQRFSDVILLLNGGVLIVVAAASYFLARRSLQPLKDVLDRQEAFASEVAHELRTPLANIMMEIESFRRTNKKLPAKYNQLLLETVSELKDLNALATNMLELMSIDYTDEQAFGELVNVGQIAREALDKMKLAAEEKGIKLVDQLSPAPVMGNHLQIKQLLTILLDNAIKYTSAKGEVTLTVKPRVRDLVEIKITDTGVGIPAEEQEKIFHHFYQVDKGGQSGAGLGLTIAQRIVSLHHGRIAVRSVPQEGSTFRVTLPKVKT